MAITVIGFFKNRSEAADALTQLTGSGFYRNDIDISYGNFAEQRSSGVAGSDLVTESDYVVDSDIVRDSDVIKDSEYVNSPDELYNEKESDKKHKGNAITRFFNSLFGDDSDDSKRYSAASQNADSIVTVHAGSREQAEEAANILDACGALDIDEGSLVSETYRDTIVSETYGESVDLNANREPIDTHIKKAGLYPFATEKVTTHTGLNNDEINNRDTEDDFAEDNMVEEDYFEEGLVGEEFVEDELVDDELVEDKPLKEDLIEEDNVQVGLTETDLADAGLHSKEIKSIKDIAGTDMLTPARPRHENANAINRQQENSGVESEKVKRRSRIVEWKIDEDLRLREEHERLHRGK